MVMTQCLCDGLKDCIFFRFVNNPSPHGDVEATLFDLILDKATSFGTGVTQDLGKDVFQSVVAYGTAPRFARRNDGVVAVVGDVEGGAETVAALLGGIAVDAAEAGNILFGAQHTGDNNGVEWYLLHSQRIEKATSDMLQKITRTRY